MLVAGSGVRIRRVGVGDEAAIERLLGSLDLTSRYRRWFTGGVDIPRAADWAAHPERFSAVGLLAIADGEAVGHAVLIPVDGERAEIAFEVAAQWRCHGIAGALLEHLLDAAAERRLHELYAVVLSENADMLAVLREHGEHAETHEGSTVIVTLPVRTPTPSLDMPVARPADARPSVASTEPDRGTRPDAPGSESTEHVGMTSTNLIDPRRVVIVGGGIAALEAVLALDDMAAGVHVTLLAPEPEFTLRPLDVARPFARGRTIHLGLETFMAEHGGRFRRTAAIGVDPDLRVVRCATGSHESYDDLIIAVGASARPAFAHALTFGADFLALNGLLADLEGGYTHTAAFVVPPGCTWPLPLYELALMTAEAVWGMCMDDVQLHLVTPEQAPLDMFGPDAGTAVEELLRAAHITLHSGVDADVRRGGHIDCGAMGVLSVARVVALPVLEGPRIDGLPADAHGFIPVDDYGRVTGLDDVYAAGDATDRPVKQGGLACQQADAVATHISAAVGAPVEAVPYAPVLRGRLLTGHGDRFLKRNRETGATAVATTPLWWPPAKVSGRYLTPYLERHGLVDLPPHAETPVAGLDVELPLAIESGA